MSFTPVRPCGVSSPGATFQSGHDWFEYSLRRAASQVGERTPCRLTMIAYLSSALEPPAAPAGQAASSAAIARSAPAFAVEGVPQTGRPSRLVLFALVNKIWLPM